MPEPIIRIRRNRSFYWRVRCRLCGWRPVVTSWEVALRAAHRHLVENVDTHHQPDGNACGCGFSGALDPDILWYAKHVIAMREHAGLEALTHWKIW